MGQLALLIYANQPSFTTFTMPPTPICQLFFTLALLLTLSTATLIAVVNYKIGNELPYNMLSPRMLQLHQAFHRLVSTQLLILFLLLLLPTVLCSLCIHGTIHNPHVAICAFGVLALHLKF